MTKKYTKREFLKVLATTPAAAQILDDEDEDEESWWEKYFGDDDEEEGAVGTIYVDELGVQETINPGSNELFIAEDTGAIFRPTDEGNWRKFATLGESPWTKTDSGALTPKEGGSLEIDKVSSETNQSSAIIRKTTAGGYEAVGRDGVISTHADDVSVVVNDVITTLGTGTEIFFPSGVYVAKQKWAIPDGTKNIVFRGELVARDETVNGTAIDARNNADSTLIEDQNATSGSNVICFHGVEKMFFRTGAGQTTIDFAGVQDCWVRGCFLYGPGSGTSSVGIVPGNNCWIENNWIEELQYGVSPSQTQIRGYMDNNLFALNDADIYLDNTLAAWSIKGNRSGSSNAWVRIEDGARLEKSAVLGTIIYGTTTTGYEVNDTAGGRGELWNSGIIGERTDAQTYMDFSGGGISNPKTNVSPAFVDPSKTILSGDPDHMQWHGVVDGGPVGGGNIDQTYVAPYDGVEVLSNGSSGATGDASGAKWSWDKGGNQWVRVDGQATYTPTS